MDKSTNQFNVCTRIKEFIDDETKGIDEYEKFISNARNNPELTGEILIIQKIKEEEEKHLMTLSEIYKKDCK